MRLRNGQKIRAIVKVLTKHTFCLLLRLREFPLDKLQIKFELDMLVLQLSITSHKLARFLRKISQQTSKIDHFRVTKRKGVVFLRLQPNLNIQL